MILFSIKDMKAGLFLKPFIESTVADAVRKWELTANDEQGSMITRFPNDFRLLQLGKFDQVVGRFEIFQDPQDMGSAADFVRRPSMPAPLLDVSSK